jgi:hypothetical protein
VRRAPLLVVAQVCVEHTAALTRMINVVRDVKRRNQRNATAGRKCMTDLRTTW